MPKLWSETIEAHRREVREATLDTTAALVAKHGLRSVTMSQIAAETGIGRATLYKYFKDVEAILVAWHERQVARHLEYLSAIRDEAGDPRERLEAVLTAYALIAHEHHGNELASLLHRRAHVARAHQRLRDLVRELVAEAAESGDVRDDVPPEELASYCLHALAGASSLEGKAAVRRLVAVTLAGLGSSRPRRRPQGGRADAGGSRAVTGGRASRDSSPGPKRRSRQEGSALPREYSTGSPDQDAAEPSGAARRPGS